jgi:serine/threonine protein kinase
MKKHKNLSGAPTDPGALEVIRNPANNELKVGQVVAGRYEILARLGEGGMGTVWRVRDRNLNNAEIALKVLLSSWFGDQTMLKRFRREVLIARKITHPSVCRVYDHGEADDLQFLTMELVSGRTLRAVIQAGPIDPYRALDILKHIAEGLTAAHKQEVIHRDLKPENVILGDDGRVVVVDFGLARSPLVDNSTVFTIAGTRPYMSPEQLRGEPIDVRSDVFALGILGFELLTGRSPFDMGSASETTSAILRDPPRALEVPSLPPAIVSRLTELLTRALAKSPGERFPSAGDFALCLANARDPIVTPPDTIYRTWPGLETRTSLAPPSSRKKRAWIAAAALAAVSAGVPVWLGIAHQSTASPIVVAPTAPTTVNTARTVSTSDPTFENGRPALVVEQFENLTADPAWNGLTQGAAETIRGALRTMPDLRLIDASPSAHASATWVVTGSIQRVGPSLRLTAQFRATVGSVAGEPIEVDGDPQNPGALLERFRRHALDEAQLFRQDHIRQHRAIHGTKSDVARTKLLEYYTMIGPAPAREQFKVGKGLLDEAIAADPRYVSALVERAYLQARWGGADTNPDGMTAARSDAKAALDADPSSPAARVMQCRVLQVALQNNNDPTDTDLAAAFDACGAALHADPSSPHVRLVISRLHDKKCEDEKAMPLLKEAIELDHSMAGRSLKHLVELALQNERMPIADTMSRRLVEVEEEERRLGTRSLSHRAGVPQTSGAHLLRATVLMRLGKPNEARAELELQLQRVSSGTRDQLDEMAALRGLLRIAADTKTQPSPKVKRRLDALERTYRAKMAEESSVGKDVAIAYQGVDPGAAGAWLDSSGGSATAGSCNEAVERATFYCSLGRHKQARSLINTCEPRHEWERSCVAWVRARLPP